MTDRTYTIKTQSGSVYEVDVAGTRFRQLEGSGVGAAHRAWTAYTNLLVGSEPLFGVVFFRDLDGKDRGMRTSPVIEGHHELLWAVRGEELQEGN